MTDEYADWEHLELTSNDPCRTTIVDAKTRAVAYTAATALSGSDTITSFKDASDQVFATLEWHSYTKDKIAFNGKEKEPVNKWLKSSKHHSTVKIQFTAEGENYSWISDITKDTNVVFKLVNDSAPEQSIAIFDTKHPNGPVKDKKTAPTEQAHPSLMLSGRAQPVKRSVILSALLIEKGHRFNGGSSLSDVVAYAVTGLFSSSVP